MYMLIQILMKTKARINPLIQALKMSKQHFPWYTANNWLNTITRLKKPW
jgi:hypothetical protein